MGTCTALTLLRILFSLDSGQVSGGFSSGHGWGILGGRRGTEQVSTKRLINGGQLRTRKIFIEDGNLN